MKLFLVYVLFSFLTLGFLFFFVCQYKVEKESYKARTKEMLEELEYSRAEKDELLSDLHRLKETLLVMKSEIESLKQELVKEHGNLAKAYVRMEEQKDLYLSFKQKVKKFQDHYKQWLEDYQKNNPPHWPPLPVCVEK